MGYKFLEHTADVQAECRAETFTGLLETAARALYSVALNKQRKSVKASHELFVCGASHEDAVVRWLQELVFLLETSGFVAVRFAWDGSHREAPEGALTVRCTAAGYFCDPADRDEEVKGATYHGLNVEKTEEGFVARIIFDL
ncbi:MAG TPA: archease [Candidatus Bathyarchaeia archaeon]|nr:archease [Candidatus Bathyarchaeia archaeon]